jgi:hypothetical protein
MRIRSTLTGFAVAAGVLLLGAPAALAQQPTSSPAPAPTSSSTTSPQPLPTAPATVRTKPQEPQVVKPRGAAETGGGGTADSQGLFAIGGAALVLTGGASVLAYRRFRKQS